MRKKQHLKNLVFQIPFLLLAASLFANSPKRPLAVEISDIRVIGDPKVGNIVTLEVDLKTNADGPVDLKLIPSKFIQINDGQTISDRNLKSTKGTTQTERFNIKVIQQGESQIDIVARLNDAPLNFKNYITKSVTIESDSLNYSVFSSLKNGSTLKSTKKFNHEFEEKRGGNKKASSLKSTTAQTTNIFNVSGIVTFFDGDDYRYEGLYGSKVNLWFRNSSKPNELWHPYTGNTEHATYTNVNLDGSFEFSFGATADFSGYNQIVLLVEPANPYISYSPPSGYVISTDEGSKVTFGFSEGAVLAFNPNIANTSYSSIDIYVKSEDGGIIKSFMFAGEFVKQRYSGNLPFSMPKIFVYKTDQGPYAGGFYSSKSKVWDFWPFSYHWVYTRYIGIDPEGTDATTICHEYGHFVTYQMWGGTYDPMANTPVQVREGWATFYSFAARNYANSVYSDGLLYWDDNTEEAPFNSPRFHGIRYADAGYPTYAAFACYLWNIYDGYTDGNFKSALYTGDNEDVSGFGLTVFEKMRSMAGKSPGDFNNLFKSGLDAPLQASVQNIYDNMLVNPSILMRPAQLKIALGSVANDNSVSINWTKNTYSDYLSYSNIETGYRLFQFDKSVGWSLISNIGNTLSSITLTNNDAAYKNYKISSYNISGNSYGDILINLPCINNIVPYTDYNSSTSISGCAVTINGGNVYNNSTLTIEGRDNVTINGNFSIQSGSALIIK